MSRTDSIPTFPPELDRNAFGHWLSGFTDGEGCFRLGIHKRNWLRYRYNTPYASFHIGLRADDLSVLKQIQSFLGCGFLAYASKVNTKSKPQIIYWVRKIAPLMDTIVSHFESYPLRAKKARDFDIWKEGVRLLSVVMQRPITHLKGRRGLAPKWTNEERNHFQNLHDCLRQQRAYDGPSIEFNTPPVVDSGDDDQPELFS